jgi:multicomponent Na+:H+ antiporter subunit B
MKSTILRTAAKIMHPLMILFALFLLLRGHNEPGGGFSGGLVAAAAFVLHALAHDAKAARYALHFEPRKIIAAGLLTAAGSGLIGVLGDEPFLTGVWLVIPAPALGDVHVGTPLFFDIGVFLVVVGTTLLIVLTIGEE